MKIQITQDDIENGKRFDPCECPVALAAKRALGVSVHVGSDSIYTNPYYAPSSRRGNRGPLDQYDNEVPLPDRVQEWIEWFDYQHPGGVEPMEFELDIPEPAS